MGEVETWLIWLAYIYTWWLNYLGVLNIIQWRSYGGMPRLWVESKFSRFSWYRRVLTESELTATVLERVVGFALSVKVNGEPFYYLVSTAIYRHRDFHKYIVIS